MGAFPKDAKQIFQYLTSVGYSPIAAAGILGNIGVEGPSGPESQGTGGGGLIGWTPESAAYPIRPIITGNEQRDLQAQLTDLKAWGARNGAGPAAMNAASHSPASAAAFWETHAERAGVVVMAERQAIAAQVYRAAKTGNWPVGGSPVSSSAGSSGGLGGDITKGIFGDLTKPFLSALGASSLSDFFERAGLVLGGLILVFIGIMQISRGGSYKDAVSSAVPNGSGGSDHRVSHRESGGEISEKSDAQVDREVREYKKRMPAESKKQLGVASKSGGSHTIGEVGSKGPNVGLMEEVPF